MIAAALALLSASTALLTASTAIDDGKRSDAGSAADLAVGILIAAVTVWSVAAIYYQWWPF